MLSMRTDELFVATKTLEDGKPSGKVYTRDGRAVYAGSPNLLMDRGPDANPQGNLQKGDLLVICGQEQKDDQMGQACKMLRDLIGLITDVEGHETASGIEWCYNKFGHMEIWNIPRSSREADLYMQSEDDVISFLDHLGMKLDDISPGDCDTAEDPGYFNQ